MPIPTKWTGSDAQIDQVVAMYRGGELVRTIASTFSCRTDLISDALRARGYPIARGGRSKLLPDAKQRLLEQYLRGATLRSLSEEFGLTTDAISSLARREGVRRDKWSTWDEARYARLRALVAEGYSQTEIAKRFDTSQSNIAVRLRHIGVAPQAPRSGANHGGWKGGRVRTGGYIYVRPTEADLQFALPNASGYVAEHRLIMGRALGRQLNATETVHHVNGDRTDNRLDNLQLRQGQHGSGVTMTCNNCGSHDISTTMLT